MRPVVDMINVSPVTALDGDVSNRVWTEKEVSYTYLRVFRCKVQCLSIFPKIKGLSLMIKRSCAFFWVMAMRSLGTDYEI